MHQLREFFDKERELLLCALGLTNNLFQLFLYKLLYLLSPEHTKKKAVSELANHGKARKAIT